MHSTHAALTWIVGILHDLDIPFEIDGGLAAHAYGATRELADIDINVPEEHFDRIVPRVQQYLHAGPAWYKDDHWDLYMMTAKYAGQNIDVSALGKTRYYDHSAREWRDFPADLSDVRVMEYDGMQLPFVNEIKLMIYKQQLGRGVDRKDVRMMEDRLLPRMDLSVNIFDAVVVGLGAMGSAAVYQLAKRGVSLLGIDRFKPPHNIGSTHGETRITRQALGEGEQYVPLAVRSYDIWRELEQETGRSLLTVTGGLTVEGAAQQRNHDEPSFFEHTIAVAEKFGISHSVLNADELRKRFPQFNFRDDERGFYENNAGLLRPEACVQAQLDMAEKHGAVLHFNERFLEFTEDEDGILTITTEQGRYRTKKLILSAGPWVTELFPQYVELFEVYRQVMYWFPIEDAVEPYLPENFPVFMIELEGDKEFYGFPAMSGKDGGLKLACEEALTHTSPENVDRTVTEREMKETYEKYVRRYLPGLGSTCLKAESCLYTFTPDRDFILDTHPDHSNVMIASPCSGHGFKHSAAIGEIIAEWATGHDSKIYISMFSLSRFDAKR